MKRVAYLDQIDVLQHVALAMCCNVLQWNSLKMPATLTQVKPSCVAVCCSVLHCVALCCRLRLAECCRVSHCVAFCRSLLLCVLELSSVAVCSSVTRLQYVHRKTACKICHSWALFPSNLAHEVVHISPTQPILSFNTKHHTAPLFNTALSLFLVSSLTVQRTATHCDTTQLVHSFSFPPSNCNTLQHTALPLVLVSLLSLQHNSTHCNILQHIWTRLLLYFSFPLSHCNTLQHTTTTHTLTTEPIYIHHICQQKTTWRDQKNTRHKKIYMRHK